MARTPMSTRGTDPAPSTTQPDQAGPTISARRATAAKKPVTKGAKKAATKTPLTTTPPRPVPVEVVAYNAQRSARRAATSTNAGVRVRARAGTKVRKTITLDPDLADRYGADEGSLSANINAALRADMERQERREALAQLVDGLDEEFGPADPALVDDLRNVFS